MAPPPAKENDMALRWKKWWAAGLVLSCGCAIDPKNPEKPDSRAEFRGQEPSGWQKIETASFNEQKNADSPELLPPPKPVSDDVPIGGATGLQVPELKPLPINLPTALRLMNARAWDISIAAEGVRQASAQLLAANVLWVPSLVAGVDYQHHDGPVQSATDGSVSNSSHSSFAVGARPRPSFRSRMPFSNRWLHGKSRRHDGSSCKQPQTTPR